MVDRKVVEKALKVYKEAWEKQDPDKIITIFTEDASYFDPHMKESYSGHKGIKYYWQTKVVEEQADIKFKLLNLWVDKDTAIAEWDAKFFNKKENVRIHLLEIAILEFYKDKIRSLREYYISKKF